MVIVSFEKTFFVAFFKRGPTLSDTLEGTSSIC